MTTLRFDGRVAIVSGAGRGLGRAYAELLAARGARVVVNDLGSDVDGSGHSLRPADETCERIRSAGGVAVASYADISTVDGAVACVADASEAFGRVDIVINNAGNVKLSDFGESDVGHLQLHLDVHVVGSFNLTHAAWPYLRASPSARVVLATSIAVFGLPGYVSYGTAKAAVIGMTMNLAVAGEPHGIRTNAVLPVADTRMALAVGVPQAELDALAQADRHRRAPERVAPLVALLAHESFTENGRIYEAGHGRFGRVFFGECRGYLNSDADMEDLVSNWKAINDEGAYFVPTTGGASLSAAD